MSDQKKLRKGRVRLQPYVSAELGQRLMSLCAARGVTETAVVQEALRQYLDGVSDTTLMLRRLDRVGRDVHKNHRDLELLTEAFSLWMKLWFAHTPSIPEEGKRAARTSAEARYKQFVDHLAEQFTGGKRFLDDLPREEFADDTELRELATRDAKPGTTSG